MSLAPDPLLRVRSQACDNNAAGVRDGKAPQAVQTPRLEARRYAVDGTVPVSLAVSMGLPVTVRQGFCGLVLLRLFRVGPALAGRNQIAHTAAHIGAPRVGTYIETGACLCTDTSTHRQGLRCCLRCFPTTSHAGC